MNQQNLKLCSEIINPSYINVASNSLNARENMLKCLLSQRSLPQTGWDELTIEWTLNTLALMDTNNFPQKVGVGERESRIFSNLVQKRHYNMGHGIGRSGDIAAVQPKAAGSSLILKLTKHLVQDAIKLSGYQHINGILLLPQATGMALSLCLLALKSQKSQAKYVIWPRIDQKTCLKCIITANLIPIVIDNIIEGDSITTNLELIEAKINELGVDNIICVFSTTSCFAPRVPDKIDEIAIICKKYKIFHLVNNAYGIQCTKIANLMNQAHAHGSVDLVVQSSDKNFLVPVGGSIVFGYDKELIKKISELYPGRACASPILDLFITLLSMGKEGNYHTGVQNIRKFIGYLHLLQERKENLQYFKDKLKLFAEKNNERVLDTPKNTISLGLTLNQFKELFTENYDQNNETNEVTKLGAILYSKKVMGSRILTDRKIKKQCDIEFKNYGTHIDNYHSMPFMTVACAVGMKKQEIDQFFKKIDESFIELRKKYKKQPLQQEQQNKIQQIENQNQQQF